MCVKPLLPSSSCVYVLNNYFLGCLCMITILYSKCGLLTKNLNLNLFFSSILGAEVHAHKICKNLESVYQYVVLFGSADISMQYVFVCISNTLDVCQIFNMYNSIYLTTYLCMQYVHGCVSGLWAGGGGQYFK